MWTWQHEHSTSPPEVHENGASLMVQSPHLQQLLCMTLKEVTLAKENKTAHNRQNVLPAKPDFARSQRFI